MIRNRLYYRIKPLLPSTIRMGIRRWLAVKKRERVLDTWPILPGSEKAPENWPGWPDGKKFAVVLTHDVEGKRGFDRSLQLMQLEAKLGFRSSFNFVPEGGDYVVSREVRTELQKNGFEVGVHDLNHDGYLFENRAEFLKKANRINKYLADWGAVGFRAGFMLRNLNWFHDLHISYDASTFDTDPFEPQPDGAATIFPFWVPRPVSSAGRSLLEVRSSQNRNSVAQSNPQLSQCGYVELPYTLPQDSTLFLLFRERHPDIWFHKLDWIAQRGGMALLDTHPDYMNFDGAARSGAEYPASRYEDFLRHIQDRYRDQYWLATATEVAEWYRANVMPAVHAKNGAGANGALKGKKAAVVLYSYYPADPRPRRAAEALVNAGMEVDMICLRQKDSEPTREVINGVNVRRVPMRRRRDSKLTYMLQYGSFIAACTAALARRSLSKRYDLVHVHNMPDVLVFSALVPRLRGARVILDQHDPMPELMRTIFGLHENSFAVRLLKALEKASIAFADQVVTVNIACKEIFSRRSCRAEKIQVVMNAPDERIFEFSCSQAQPTRDAMRPFVLMYHGSIVERHGLDLAVQAVNALKEKIPNIELQIYGASTPFLESVMESVKQSGLDQYVRYLGSKSLEEIAKAIRQCDLGLIPNRRSIFTEINTPTRIFEYLALGKPVIAPRVPGITDYFGSDDLIFFELGDAGDLTRQIERAYFCPEEIAKIIERGQMVYQKHCWTREKQAFVGRVEEILNTPRR